MKRHSWAPELANEEFSKKKELANEEAVLSGKDYLMVDSNF